MQGRVFLGARQAAPPKYVFAARDRMDETYDIIRAVRDERYKYIRNFQPEQAVRATTSTTCEDADDAGDAAAEQCGRTRRPADAVLPPQKPDEELYDTQADPYEISNLADCPSTGAAAANARRARPVDEGDGGPRTAAGG